MRRATLFCWGTWEWEDRDRDTILVARLYGPATRIEHDGQSITVPGLLPTRPGPDDR